MSHTPGPWTVRGHNSELPQVWDEGFNNCVTDRVFNGNARLIAAAPELLAACREVESFLEDQRDLGLDVPELRTVRAAITKAEGANPG